jgi:aminoglycoside phosphotransferase (APT) family kinase protein
VLDAVGHAVPVPVPGYVAAGERSGLPWGAYTKIPGRSGQQAAPSAPARPHVASQLGALLVLVHHTPAPAACRPARRRPWRGRLEELPSLADAIAADPATVVTPEMRRYLAADVDPPPPSARSVLCHADLKGEHVLMTDGGTHVAGVIDWGDARVEDPAVDVAGLVIWLGPAFARDVAAHGLLEADPGIVDRAVHLARVGMLWGLGMSLQGRAHWPLPLARTLVRTAFLGGAP